MSWNSVLCTCICIAYFIYVHMHESCLLSRCRACRLQSGYTYIYIYLHIFTYIYTYLLPTVSPKLPCPPSQIESLSLRACVALTEWVFLIKTEILVYTTVLLSFFWYVPQGECLSPSVSRSFKKWGSSSWMYPNFLCASEMLVCVKEWVSLWKSESLSQIVSVSPSLSEWVVHSHSEFLVCHIASEFLLCIKEWVSLSKSESLSQRVSSSLRVTERLGVSCIYLNSHMWSRVSVSLKESMSFSKGERLFQRVSSSLTERVSCMYLSFSYVFRICVSVSLKEWASLSNSECLSESLRVSSSLTERVSRMSHSIWVSLVYQRVSVSLKEWVVLFKSQSEFLVCIWVLICIQEWVVLSKSECLFQRVSSSLTERVSHTSHSIWVSLTYSRVSLSLKEWVSCVSLFNYIHGRETHDTHYVIRA